MKLCHTSLLGLFILIMFSLTSCDPCRDVTCNNGGTCNEGTCDCPDGTEGNACETVWRDAILGTYKCSRICDSSQQPYEDVVISAGVVAGQVSVALGTRDMLECKMTSPNSFAFSQNIVGQYSVTGIVNGNTLTIKEDYNTFGVIVKCTTTGNR